MYGDTLWTHDRRLLSLDDPGAARRALLTELLRRGEAETWQPGNEETDVPRRR